MTLLHARQPAGYGCLWSAIYAITHDPAHLVHRANASHTWAAAKLAEEGYVLETHYNGWYEQRPTPPQWWEAFRGHLLGIVPLLLTVRAPGAARAHEIAALYPGPDDIGSVTVSDSEQWGLLTLTTEEFHRVYGHRTLLVRSLTNLSAREINPHTVTS